MSGPDESRDSMINTITSSGLRESRVQTSLWPEHARGTTRDQLEVESDSEHPSVKKGTAKPRSDDSKGNTTRYPSSTRPDCHAGFDTVRQ